MRRPRCFPRVLRLEPRDLPSAVIHIDGSWFQQNPNAPFLLTQPDTRYVLDSDIRVTGTAFVAGAANVTLDLNGHQIIYGDSAALQVSNGGFEQARADGSIPGWDLSRAPAATRVPAITGMWGQWMLQLSAFSSTQTIVSDAIAIPSANHEYAAAITPKGDYDASVTLSVIDAITGAVLGTANSESPDRGFAPVVTFSQANTDPVRLQIDVTPAAGKTANMALDYATLVPSRDYGIVASPQWIHQWPVLLQTSAIQNIYRSVANFTVTNGSIVQGRGQGASSSPLFFEELAGFTVANVSTITNGMNSPNLDASWAKDGTVRDSTFQAAVDRVPDRMHIVAAINLTNFDGSAMVTGNRIMSVPQVGILFSGMATMQHLTISNNDIRQNAIATDGYGIALAGALHFEIDHNTIAPINGRGILLDAWGRIATQDGQIHDNLVTSVEVPNLEYDARGLEATALRLRGWNTTHSGLVIRDNTFIAKTGLGGDHEALAARISAWNGSGQNNAANNLIANNRFEAIVTTTDSNYQAVALSISNVGSGTGLQINGNLLASNDTALNFGDSDSYQGANDDITFVGDVIGRSSDGPTRLFSSVVAGGWRNEVSNIRLSNIWLENGATPNIVLSGTSVSGIQTDWHTGSPAGGEPPGGVGASLNASNGNAINANNNSGTDTISTVPPAPSNLNPPVGSSGLGGSATINGSNPNASPPAAPAASPSPSSNDAAPSASISAAATARPSLSGNAAAQPILFVAADGQVWSAPAIGAHQWGNPSLTQHGQVRAISNLTDAQGTAAVFAIGLDNQVWTEVRSANGPWMMWSLVRPGAVRSISAVSSGSGTEVFGVGWDNQVYMTQQGVSGYWTPWALTQPGRVRTISAIVDSLGRPEVFATGLDHQIWLEAVAAGHWSPWTLTHPGIVRDFATAVDSHGRAEVLAIGLDDQVWSELGSAMGSWSDWTLVRTGAVQSVHATTDSSGNVEAFAVGLDDRLWFTTESADHWDPWSLATAGQAILV